MSNKLSSRIATLEANNPERPRRVVSVVSGEDQEAEVRQLLLSEGFDPDDEDLFIIRRVIVSPPGEEPYSDPPYILRVGG